MWIKLIIVLCILASLVVLGLAARDLLVGKEQLAKRLTQRIILSLLAFIVVIAAYYLGWIHPHPLGHLPG